MNNFMPKSLHCINSNTPITEMSVMQRPITYLNENEQLSGFLFGNNDQGLGELFVGRALKPDPGMENGWADDDFGRLLKYGNASEFEATCAIPRTASCPPAVVAEMAEVAANEGRDSGFDLNPATGKGNSKKRKADKSENIKCQEKKMKVCAEEKGSKITEENSNSNSTITNASRKKDKSNVSDIPKLDYIHVRARRGQATDSHSLAERVRREKISERMKYLQDLVPGCNKITGKAGMLDEIINYVQSLQKQVELLFMKLAIINPQLNCEADNYLIKEMYPACTSSAINAAQLQFNMLSHKVSESGLDIGVIHSDSALRRTISAPVHIPETVLDSSCFNQRQQLNWDVELHNMFGMDFHQGRPPSFVSQPLTSYIETGHVKMEM